MEKTTPTTSRNKLRDLFVFAAMFLVILTSCPIKNGLLSLAGIQANTEQGLAKKGNLRTGNELELCVYIETQDTLIAPGTSFNAGDLLPVLLLTATFLFLFGISSSKELSHPLYGNIKISGTLPLFLQYRKLVI